MAEAASSGLAGVRWGAAGRAGAGAGGRQARACTGTECRAAAGSALLHATPRRSCKLLQVDESREPGLAVARAQHPCTWLRAHGRAGKPGTNHEFNGASGRMAGREITKQDVWWERRGHRSPARHLVLERRKALGIRPDACSVAAARPRPSFRGAAWPRPSRTATFRTGASRLAVACARCAR